ncbi:MAG TPA: DUF1302 domain-containing protein [Gammaproteobacteria bacterium]|nr:DUF1302 domain-containing protein [Gammaproteobacteria bacterium]
MSTQPSWARPGNGCILATAIAAVLAATYAVPAAAVPIETNNWSGSWDTTLTYGALWRVQGPDCRLIANANGGCGRSANIDDGNLNYPTGSVSSLVKATSEIEMRFRDSWGFFARGTGFYDWKAGDTARTELSESALTRVEEGAKMLDYFVYVPFSLGDMPAEFRLGNQVISWGESTFIQGGINLTNSFDVAQLRLPGSELKEALVPQGMAYFNVSPTENFSIEAYYQYDWQKVVPDPVGSYFSGNDLAGKGGTHAMLGFGRWSDLGTDFTPLGGAFDPTFVFVPRGESVEADDGRQYGLALRYFADQVMGGMEFGLYYLRYHSRLPVVSGMTGTQAGFGNAAAAATAAQAAALGLASGLSFDAAVNTATAQAMGTAASLGGDITEEKARDRATIAANAFLGAGSTAVGGLANAFAQDELAQTSRYFTEYPEDLDLFGFSWSGYLFNTGIAWQGEVSYKPDSPLQVDDVELLFAALGPLDNLTFNPDNPYVCATNPAARGNLGCFNQLGVFGLNTYIPGYVELDVWQTQTTFTYLSGPMLGANTGAFVVEAGVTYVPDLPDTNSGGPNGRGLRLNGEGTSLSGNVPLSAAHFGELDPRSAFPHKTSWGYRFRGALIYNNAIGPWTITPIVGWSHDVNGNSPGPAGNFIDGRRSLSFGLKGTLRNKYELELNYAEFGGAGIYNTTRDRDFISFTAKVSF